MRDARPAENEPTPNVPVSVVVVPYDDVAPQLKPRTVEEALPSSDMIAPNVTDVCEIFDTTGFISVGADILTGQERVEKSESEVVVVP